MIVIGRKKSVLLPSSKQISLYTRSRTRRYFESVGGDLESTTEHERSYRSNIIMCVITICLKNSSVARPSSSRAATGCQTDHRRLPAICLAAMVGLTTAEQRNRLQRLLLRLRRGGFLPADSPSFKELARDADLGLFRSISSTFFGTTSVKGSTLGTISVLERTILPSR